MEGVKGTHIEVIRGILTSIACVRQCNDLEGEAAISSLCRVTAVLVDHGLSDTALEREAVLIACVDPVPWHADVSVGCPATELSTAAVVARDGQRAGEGDSDDSRESQEEGVNVAHLADMFEFS